MSSGIDSIGRGGQSFTPAQNNISGFGLTLKTTTPGTSPLTIQIWDRLWTAGGAVMLVQQTATATANAGFTMNDVFWTPVAVTPGQRYFARFLAADNFFITGGFIFNPYTGGTAITNNSPSFETGTSATDITFRTFYDTEPGTGVPEPSGLLLVASGLATLMAIRRRP